MAKKYTVVSPDGNEYTTSDIAYYQRLRAQGYEDKQETSSRSSSGGGRTRSADTNRSDDNSGVTDAS